MDKNRRRVFGRLAILAFLILVPLTFLFYFSSGKQHFTPPGYFGPKKPIVENGVATGDSSHFKIEDFQLHMLSGDTLLLSEFTDKIIVAMVIGNTCPGDCEIQPEALKKIMNKEIGENASYNDLVVLCEFVDYDADRTPMSTELNEFYRQDFDPDRWKFFTCERNKLYDFKPYPDTDNLLESSISGARNGFTYYSIAVLIDKNHHVRGLYNLNNSAYVRDLLDGIKLLKKEEDYANN